MNRVNLKLSVQRALIGQVPASLRFLYVFFTEDTLNFHAVFTADASDEDIEAVSIAATEVISDCKHNVQLNELYEKDSSKSWKIGNGENLMFLRYGDL